VVLYPNQCWQEVFGDCQIEDSAWKQHITVIYDLLWERHLNPHVTNVHLGFVAILYVHMYINIIWLNIYIINKLFCCDEHTGPV